MSQSDSLMDSQFKLGDLIKEHDCVINGKFCAENYVFPEMPIIFNELNRKLDDEIIIDRNFDSAFSSAAKSIGFDIGELFHLATPLSVLRNISFLFGKSKKFKNIKKNFERVKVLKTDSYAKFRTISELILHHLILWRNASMRRLKRQNIWEYRNGASKLKLEAAAKNKKEREEKQNLMKKFNTPKAKLAKANKKIAELIELNDKLHAELEEKNKVLSSLSETSLPESSPPTTQTSPSPPTTLTLCGSTIR